MFWTSLGDCNKRIKSAVIKKLLYIDIRHCVFPRLLEKPMRWLAICVALSRVRRLKDLRSSGLNKDIRKIMEEGPPDSLPAQFHKLCNEKATQTALDADAAMAALGWA